MPHFIIEHSSELDHDSQRLMSGVFSTAKASGLFLESSIKIRKYSCSEFQFGSQAEQFIHITAKILCGRTDEQKTILSESLLEYLTKQFPHITSLSIDVVDMDKTCYRKIEL